MAVTDTLVDSGGLQDAAWPHMLDSLQAAYAELTETQWTLERHADDLNEARELFEQVVESMSEGLLLLDRRGRLLRVNRSACELLEGCREDLRGRQLSELWLGERVPVTPWELFEQSRGGKPITLDRELRGPSGRTVIVQAACSLVRDERERVNGLLIIARDVTASRREEVGQRLLAEVSGLLAESLDYTRTVRLIADRLVEGAAGWAVVYERSGRDLHRLAEAGSAPELAPVLRSRDATPGSPLEEALRKRRSTLFAEDGDDPTDSWLVVPLAIGRRNLGALAIGGGERRRLDDADLRLHAEIARRIALAIENARLHRALDRSRRAAEETAAMVARVQQITDVALTHLDLEALLHELLERIARGVEADRACVLLRPEPGSPLAVRAALGLTLVEAEALLKRIAPSAASLRDARRPLALDDPDGRIHAIQRDHVGTEVGVPLSLRGRGIGLLHVGTDEPRRFSEIDLRLLALVAERSALAIDNASLFERERGIAETLQRSLLPDRLPTVPGMALAARYFPGTAGVEVGGDWYDVVALPDGRLGVIVGDVVGRGVRAAADMGQLRTALRTYLFEGLGPAAALEHLDRLSTELQDGIFATVLCLLFDPASGTATVANAGHLSPLLRRSEGPTQLAEVARSVPLGTHMPASYPESELRLDSGDTLLLYTDGLVERRREALDVGLERLVRSVEQAPMLIEDLLDHVVRDLFGDEQRDDDTALLVVRRVPEQSTLTLRLPVDVGVLADLRTRLRHWLAELGATEAEQTDILIASGEICANAIEHPVDPRSDEFELTLGWRNRTVELTVRDTGRWNPRGRPGGPGFGLDLARAMMDDVAIDRDDAGTTVRLRRRLGVDRAN